MAQRERTYRITQKHVDNDGSVISKTTDTDTIIDQPGGVTVLHNVRGKINGKWIDRTTEKFYKGVTFENACSYRRDRGWAVV